MRCRILISFWLNTVVFVSRAWEVLLLVGSCFRTLAVILVLESQVKQDGAWPTHGWLTVSLWALPNSYPESNSVQILFNSFGRDYEQKSPVCIRVQKKKKKNTHTHPHVFDPVSPFQSSAD